MNNDNDIAHGENIWSSTQNDVINIALKRAILTPQSDQKEISEGVLDRDIQQRG